MEFHLQTKVRAAKTLRKFLQIPETPTGFDDLLAPVVTKRLEAARKFSDFGEDK